MFRIMKDDRILVREKLYSSPNAADGVSASQVLMDQIFPSRGAA